MLLEIGILWACLWFVADYRYTVGASDLALGPLYEAAKVFPFYSEYRLGPARLIIRDNIWEDPKLAANALRQIAKYDPYSKFIGEWISALENGHRVSTWMFPMYQDFSGGSSLRRTPFMGSWSQQPFVPTSPGPR